MPILLEFLHLFRGGCCEMCVLHVFYRMFLIFARSIMTRSYFVRVFSSRSARVSMKHRKHALLQPQSASQKASSRNPVGSKEGFRQVPAGSRSCSQRPQPAPRKVHQSMAPHPGKGLGLPFTCRAQRGQGPETLPTDSIFGGPDPRIVDGTGS